MATSTAETTELFWLPANDKYHLALDGGRLVCRNRKGKQLASVPKAAKTSQLGEQLLGLVELLERHAQECRETVETWMLRSLPIPRRVLLSIWPDPTWQELLKHAVVAVWDEGSADPEEAGFLHEIDPQKGIGVVDLDGETRWLDAPRLMLPHPILLQDLDDYRELSTDLDLQQGLPQLFRETYGPPEEVEPSDTRITDYSGGFFPSLMQAFGVCRRLGYRTSGGFAVCRAWEQGQGIEARYWIGSDMPEAETYTDDLTFTDAQQHALKLVDVGPVVMSEGRRMAAAIYAQRKVEENS